MNHNNSITVDWDQIIHFKPSEFPSQKEIDLTEPILFKVLDNFRSDLGCSIYPSPVKGALAREYGHKTSRHYAIGRLSTAIDFFVDCNTKKTLSTLSILSTLTHYFGGIGIYFDTHFRNRKWIMFHGDLRKKQQLWYRDGDYYTIHTETYYLDLIKRIKQIN